MTEKKIKFESGQIIFLFNNFFYWQMAQPFAVQNLNFEQKRGSRFLLSRFIESFPLELEAYIKTKRVLCGLD